MADVFISHSSKDHLVAEQLCEGLEANGISCWMAPRDITAGTEWAVAINNAISSSKVFLIIYSECSAQSKQVSKELGLAGARGIPMIPYKIDSTPLAAEFEYYLLTSHWIAADAAGGEYKFVELREAVMRLLADGQENAVSVPAQQSVPVWQSAPVVQSVPFKQVEPVQQTALVTQEAQLQPARSDKHGKKNSMFIPIIAAAAVFLVVLGIVIAVLLAGGSDKDESSGASVTTSDAVQDSIPQTGESAPQTTAGTSGTTAASPESEPESEPEEPMPEINYDALSQVGVDIEPYDSKDCYWLNNSYDDSFTVAGVEYNTGLVLKTSGAHASFNAGGMYEKMGLRVGRLDGSRYGNDLTVHVYFDGEEQPPIKLAHTDVTKLCELDIKGVKEVRLQVDFLLGAPNIALTDFYFSTSADSGFPSSCKPPFDETLDTLNIPLDLAPYEEVASGHLQNSYDESYSVAGFEYNNGIMLNAADGDNRFILNADGAFRRMSFSVGRVDGNDNDAEVTVRLYFDGKEQQPIRIAHYALPKVYEYDVTGVKQIKISADWGLGYPKLFFSDFYLFKDENATAESSYKFSYDTSLDTLNVPVDIMPYEFKATVLANDYDESFEMGGRSYNTGVYMKAFNADYLQLALDGSYKSLSLTAGFAGDKETRDTNIKVYFDGIEQHPIQLKKGSLPQDLTYDITGVELITIACDGHFQAPYIGLADIVISR